MAPAKRVPGRHLHDGACGAHPLVDRIDVVRSIRRAALAAKHPVEVVVVANRCTDATATIAEGHGAVVVQEEARNIAAVRNAGARVSTGDTIVTVDADCEVHISTLLEVRRLLGSGRCVGGGTKVVPERRSPGITATYAVMEAVTAVIGLGGGLFWCSRVDFEAIGGFDEAVEVGEDLDFARRLRARGRTSGRRFTTIRTAPLVASCRKFDRFGDWHMFGLVRELPRIRAALDGTDTSWTDQYFYDFNG